jgi:hypothetical protein
VTSSILPLPQTLLVARGGGIATAASYLQWSLPVVIRHCCTSIVVFMVAAHLQVNNCSGTMVVRTSAYKYTVPRLAVSVHWRPLCSKIFNFSKAEMNHYTMHKTKNMH